MTKPVKTKINNRDAAWGLFFVSIPLLSTMFFVFLPAIFSIHISTTEWNGFVPLGLCRQ